MARCTVVQLVLAQSLLGEQRGRRCRTSIPNTAAYRPLDLVDGHFTATHANQLLTADFARVAT